MAEKNGGLFQNSILNKYLATLDAQVIDEAYQRFCAFFHDTKRQKNILSSKEEQYQEGFLNALFVGILGYTLNPEPDYNLITEKKDTRGQKKADGAILQDGEVIGVVELKDHKTPNLDTVERQVFGYKNQHKKATYVIVSNFQRLRFYIDNAVEYIEWNLFTLTRSEFAILWLCLNCECLMRGLPKTIKNESVSNEEQITNKLYKDYIAFKRELFGDILKRNTTEEGEHSTPEWKILLFKKTQKLLDRMLFIFFAEDSGLLPPNSIKAIIDQWRMLIEADEDIRLYNRIKKYFGYMNTGYKGKKYEVFAYNGGLFKPDEVLDGLEIDDELLAHHTLRLSEYDFASDVDVNILGHIFENSLNEIEEVTAQLENGEAPAVSKRKKDGVFYTPQYITKYIVENTVGRLCNEKKLALGIDELEYYSDEKRSNNDKKRMVDALTAYREWLLQITICDPACGSGAFLNAALRFLMDEHHRLDEMEANVTGSTIVFPGIENSILENNLFGVDINEESVEIARLALWLRTAKPYRKLSSLNNNIKCGNSLISDPAVAGDKAFNWEEEFPQVFAKGGFDVVIGNPPYVNVSDEIQKNYYKRIYNATEGRIDLYEVFIQLGMQILKDKGRFAFINPNTVLSNLYSQKLRKEMLHGYGLYEVINFAMDVFEDPTVHTCILLMHKNVEYSSIGVKRMVRSPEDIELPNDYEVFVSEIESNKNLSFDLTISPIERSLFRKLTNHLELSSICHIRQCIKTGNDPLYVQVSDTPLPDPWKKTLRGKGMGRYLIKEENVYLKYGDWLARNWKNQSFFECNKIAIRETGDRITACLDEDNRYFLSSLYSVYPKEEYTIDYLKALLSILNSNIATFFVQKIAFDLTEGAFTKVRTNQLGRLPIPAISNSAIANLSDLADRMLSLTSNLHNLRSRFHRRMKENLGIEKITTALETFDLLTFETFTKELKKQKVKLTLVQQDEWEDYFNQYKAECEAKREVIRNTDAEIDRLIYSLYGLTEDEIAIVEGI